MKLAGARVGGEFYRGFMCYGIPLGSDMFVKLTLQEKAEEIARNAERTIEVLSGDRQALWSVLRLSTSHRFKYFCQLTPPSLMEPVAAWLDERLWQMLETATSLQIPQGEGCNMAIRCPVAQLDGKSYQEWLIRLPIRFHGWGMRSLKETCGPSYLGATETAIPFMAARDMLCPQREQEWGGRECLGQEAMSEARWRVVLGSGCQEGRELRRVWQGLTRESRQAAHWLGEDMEEVFTTSVQGVGGTQSVGRPGAS